MFARPSRRPAILLLGLGLLVALMAGAVAAVGARPAPSDGRPGAGAGGPPNTISGRVLSPAGAPIAGVDVSIASIDREVVIPEIPIVTGLDGAYRTMTLPAGRYELVVGAPGYRPAVVIVTVVDGAAAEAPEPVLVPER